MNINSFLKDLIITNRRVIIPDLGAFLHTGEDDKEVAFSSFLRYNDEFLEKSLMKEFKISSFEATKNVHKLTDTINMAIRTYGRYAIEGFGYFISENDNLSFVLDTDAVNNFNTNFLDIKENVAPIENKQSGAPHIPKPEQNYNNAKAKSFDKKKLLIISLLSIASICIFAFLFVNNKSTAPVGIENDLIVDVTEPSKIKKEEPVIVKDTVPKQEKTSTVAVNTEEKKEKEEVKDDITKKDTIVKKSVAENIIVESTNTSDKVAGYHVIAGCFLEKLNAERFMEECMEKGFKSAKIIDKIGDLYPVSLLKFNNKNEATSYINNNYDDELWVYRSF